MSVKAYFHKKVVQPLLQFLKQGLSPQKLALSLALGFVIGHFPVYGTTTTLCAMVAVVFRLNLPAIQLANYLALPTQLLAILPLIRWGSLFVGTPFLLSIDEMIATFEADWLAGFQKFGMALLQGAVGWGMVAPFLVLVLYVILLPFMKRFSQKVQQQSPAHSVDSE